MSTPISKNQIVEEGVLDNLLNPLKLAQEELRKTDAELQKLADSMGKLGNAESAKGIRELAEAEKELNAVYETKKKVQRESIDVDNEAEKIKKKIAQASSDEAKELALLKEELAAVNREQKANAKATRENLSAYKELEKETRNAKNESKELGAQLRQLANEGKQNTDEYKALSDTYQQATQRAASLDKELKGLDKSVGDNFRNVGNYESALDNLNQKMLEGGMSMREMSQLIREYQRIAIEAGQTSPIGQQALAQAGQLKDKISDVGAVTKALSTDNINLDATFSVVKGGAGAWQAYAGFAQIAGKKNEDIMKGLQKLAAIQSILNGLKQVEATLNKNNIALLRQTTIWQKASAAGALLYAKATAASTVAMGGATTASRALTVAMIAIPFIAIATGIALLIMHFDKVKKAVEDAVNWFNELREKSVALRYILGAMIAPITGVIKVLKMLGVIESDVAKQASKAAEEQAKFMATRRKQVDAAIQDNKRLRDTIEKTYDFEIAKAKAAGKDVFALEQKKREEMILTYKTDLKLMAARARLEVSNIQAALKLREDIIKTLDEINTLENEMKLANISREKEMNDKARQLREERLAREKKLLENLRNQRLAEFDKFLQDITKFHSDELLLTKSRQEQEEFLVSEKYKNLIEQAKKYGQDVAQIEAARDRELAEISKRYAMQAEIDKQNELNKQLELSNIENSLTKEQFERLERERKIAHLEKMIEIEKAYGRDVMDLEIQLARMRQDLQEDETKKTESQAQEIANKLTEIYNKSADLAIASLQRQQEAAANMFNAFAQMAANGNIEASQSMAEMIERQEQLQRRQEQIERRKLAMQRATGASAILTKAIEAGKPLPVALAEMGAFLAANLPSFYDGTENTGKGGKLDKNGGFLATLHKGERVITENQNRLIGDVSNPVVADVVYKWRTGQLENNGGNSAELMHRLTSEMREIKTAIQNQPQQIIGLEETISGLVKMVVSTKKGSHSNNTYQS